MARQLRIEFPGAIYHVTSRGDRREPIFVDDFDRRTLLEVVQQGMARFNAAAFAYCLMDNHYHFVLHTREANLSKLMRHINGVYTQAFNRRHDKVGHLFQGRFNAILVDRDAYLLQVSRYVERNPLRAGLVAAPADWLWSSYRAHVGIAVGPTWLDSRALHELLTGGEVADVGDRQRAADRYASLVGAAGDRNLWDDALKQQIYLGNEAFIEKMQAHAKAHRLDTTEVPKAQRSKPLPLDHWLLVCASREEALWRAHTESGLSMSQLARELRLSVSRVSRLIRKAEELALEVM
jgi:putative transposase